MFTRTGAFRLSKLVDLDRPIVLLYHEAGMLFSRMLFYQPYEQATGPTGLSQAQTLTLSLPLSFFLSHSLSLSLFIFLFVSP